MSPFFSSVAGSEERHIGTSIIHNAGLLKEKMVKFVILCEVMLSITYAIPAFLTVEDSADVAKIEEPRGLGLEI